MAKRRSKFNFDKSLFGFNLSEHGVKSFTKSIKVGPFQQTININLGNGHVHGTTSIPGTGLSKRYTISDTDWHDWFPEEPDFGHKPPMWHDDNWLHNSSFHITSWPTDSINSSCHCTNGAMRSMKRWKSINVMHPNTSSFVVRIANWLSLLTN